MNKFKNLFEKATRSDGTTYHRVVEGNQNSEACYEIVRHLNDDSIEDIGYEIAYRAAAFLEDADPKDFDTEGNYTGDMPELASVWTFERLSYLNNDNQRDISDILKEYGCEDIATAAAIWYNQQVAEAINLLTEKIK